ncbi:hypothetical protein [Halorussus ruber]|uniref:hypothetical protein n=1 Tax=Halorussus ruber TaxID=1126238 RepID=UPI00143D220F|nr:hypothetical protein [Halorussus ruber]
MAVDSLRAVVRGRRVQWALALLLFAVGAVVASAQGGVLPAAFGAVVGLVAAGAVSVRLFFGGDE